MSWSFRIARIAGIDIKIHYTFLLLLAVYGWIGYQAGFRSGGQAAGTSAAITEVVFILLLFLCVLLHEFGHAFAARAFGIRTPDITLLPFGGVARLERMPEKPVQELIVAIAGPAVNVAIICGLLTILPISAMFSRGIVSTPFGDTILLPQLMQVNFMLILFNLIPAFPMDGGRVLRALLAMQLNYATATRVAARIGQGIAVLFVAGYFGIQYLDIRGVPFFNNPMLIFIAMFVYQAAQQELAYVEFREAGGGPSVAEVMNTQFKSLAAQMSIRDALAEIQTDPQVAYPVVDHDLRAIGVISAEKIHQPANDPAQPISSLVRPGVLVPSAMSVQQLKKLLPADQHGAILPVVNSGGQIVGLLASEQLL